jgi:CdiI immunity protein
MKEGHSDNGGDKTGPVSQQDWSVRYPELERLFATHFVESWSSLYGSSAEALRDGIDDRSLDELRVVLTELDDLLALRLDEPELQNALFHDLGSYYHPVGQSQTEWLADVASQLDAAIRERAAKGDSVDPRAEEL